MAKSSSRNRGNSHLKEMKLIAIKEECYALSGAATTTELKRKYHTLCSNRDFRKRATWEYVLKNLRTDGDWIGIRIADLESLAEAEQEAGQYQLVKSQLGVLTFHPKRVEMDKAAENDD
jgi:hypothetical protein